MTWLKRRALNAHKMEAELEPVKRAPLGQGNWPATREQDEGTTKPAKVFERLVKDSRERAKSKEKLEMLKLEKNEEKERELQEQFDKQSKFIFLFNLIKCL